MNESPKVLYYLGAGASANAIPVVNGLNFRINDLVEHLRKYTLSQDLKAYFKENESEFVHGIKERYSETLLKVIEDLTWLLDKSKKKLTIDVLAKQLHDVESSDYNKLKKALITYFYFEQSIDFKSSSNDFDDLSITGIDKRYSQFISNLSSNYEGTYILNNNVKICSWNYDSQIELELKSILDDGIINIKHRFQIYPNFKSYGKTKIENYDQSKFAVFKLNGTALPHSIDIPEKKITPFDSTEGDEEHILSYLKFYDENFQNNSSPILKLFNFSFENNRESLFKNSPENIISKAKSSILNSDFLIIIGYSFPDVNRVIDNFLLNDLRPNKIVIQDKDPYKILQKLKSICPDLSFFIEHTKSKDYPKVQVELDSQIDTFYIPQTF